VNDLLTARIDWQRRCLLVNPFESDFGDGERVLSDKIVGARKVHFPGCLCCFGGIAKDEAHRARVEVSHGQARTYRWCQLCCEAMAIASLDCGAEWAARDGLYASSPAPRSVAQGPSPAGAPM